MLLVIDVGNSQTVSGVFKKGSLICHWRLKTDRKKTADELAARFLALFAMHDIRFKDISAVVIASVVPTQQQAWQEFSSKYINCTPLLVDGTSIKTGIKIATENPNEVGADRIVNTVAAFEQYRKATIVVDFGTAITFDCISAEGEYLGGVIVPGMSISLDALASRTAKLPRVDISIPPQKAIGANTVDAIKSGLLYGYGAMVDGLIKKLSAEFSDIPQVIATGGMSELLSQYTKSIQTVDPFLTLKGLQILYEKNK
ncbi:MAG: type III pantothenate kinase [Deltaproteobacteria bacterium]|jgi:type III pantothenate kinase|nr:type III pantothenate kinase [Deltaproteobacteria bacterium]